MGDLRIVGACWFCKNNFYWPQLFSKSIRPKYIRLEAPKVIRHALGRSRPSDSSNHQNTNIFRMSKNWCEFFIVMFKIEFLKWATKKWCELFILMFKIEFLRWDFSPTFSTSRSEKWSNKRSTISLNQQNVRPFKMVGLLLAFLMKQTNMKEEENIVFRL